MKVSTNKLFSEGANHQIEAEKLGLKLIGIVCPLVELIALKGLLDSSTSTNLRIITRKGTIGHWYEQNRTGVIPAKKGLHARGSITIDWINNLKSTSRTSHLLRATVKGKHYNIEVKTIQGDDLHTKLYIYDGGFVITSANITEHGTLFRHLEIGILITVEDNELEVEVVKQWFEDAWIGAERSCLAIRRQILKSRKNKKEK